MTSTRTEYTYAQRLVLGTLHPTAPRTPAQIKGRLPGRTPVDTIRTLLAELQAAGLVQTAEHPTHPTTTSWVLTRAGSNVLLGRAPESQEHTLVVFNAVDVPMDVQTAVMRLLDPYDADIYTRAADASGRAL